MDESEWRRLGRAALAELTEMGFDPRTESEVRQELADALAVEGGRAKTAIRAVLTSRPALREWLRERVGGEAVRSGRPMPAEAADAAGSVEGGQPQPAQQQQQQQPPAARPVPAARPPAAAPPVPAARPPAAAQPVPATRPPAAAEPGPSPTRTAHARLEAPATVRVEEPFALIVGLAPTPSAGVLGAGFQVPTGPLTLTVSLLLDGFRTVDGSSAVRTLVGSDDVPYPAAVVDLVAIDDPAYRSSRSILAVYAVDGHQLGVATRIIEVRTEPVPDPRSAPAGRPQVWALPTGGAPDLEITVARGNDRDGRVLQWTAHSPHPEVTLPSEPVSRAMDERAAGELAQRFMRGVEQRRGADDLETYLRGVQLIVGDQVPREIWAALASAARVVGRPTVLFATADPFIPWELASVPEPWDTQRPALLGAQTDFGRWLYDDNSDVAAPALTVAAEEIAVVKGEYAGSARLPQAEAEADHLVASYGARLVRAEVSTVLACLKGDPPADVVHFAVHGKLDVTGVQDGIVMNDRSTLDFVSIRGVGSGRPRLAFLNACQVGQGQQVLGDPAGVVPSFIRIGAQAVIAPLWKVDDTAAREFAERFYTAVFSGRTVSEVLAEERTRALAAGAGDSPGSTTLAYLFFGHPRLTVTRRQEDSHAAAPA